MTAFVFLNTQESVWVKLNKYFSLKSCSVGESKLYLGAKISVVNLPNGVNAWAMRYKKLLGM